MNTNQQLLRTAAALSAALPQAPLNEQALVLPVRASQVDLGDHLQVMLRTTAQHWQLKKASKNTLKQALVTSRYLLARQSRQAQLRQVRFAY